MTTSPKSHQDPHAFQEATRSPISIEIRMQRNNWYKNAWLGELLFCFSMCVSSNLGHQPQSFWRLHHKLGRASTCTSWEFLDSLSISSYDPTTSNTTKTSKARLLISQEVPDIVLDCCGRVLCNPASLPIQLRYLCKQVLRRCCSVLEETIYNSLWSHACLAALRPKRRTVRGCK